MSLSFASLPTWMTLPLDPDGASGSLLARLTSGLGSTGLAILGAALLFTGESHPWGVAASVAGLAVAVAFAAIERPRFLLARHLLLRLWLLLASASLYSWRRPNEVTLIWVTASVLVLVLAAEPVLRAVVNVQRSFVAHLPGMPPDAQLLAPLATIPLAVLAVTVGGGVLAELRAPALIWALLALGVALFAGAVALTAARQVLLDGQRRGRLRKATRAYAPEFVIYTAFPEDASYQVTMWLPYLARTGRKFVVITRDEEPAKALAALVDVPVLCCRSIEEVEAALVPSLTTVFYVNASSGNGHMVRHSHLSHVFLGHGDSDKATSSNPTHAMYDVLFVAGHAAIERYAAHGVHIPRDRFAIVGRPQVEGVLRTDQPIAELARSRPSGELAVLYAPTWRGAVDETAVYSLPHGEGIVRGLLAKGARVIFRPHPFTYRDEADVLLVQRIWAILEEDRAGTGRQHVWGEDAETAMSIFDCFNASDAMVSDVSSVVSDYLYSGKPFALYSPGLTPDAFLADFPVARAAYRLAGDLSNLDLILELTLSSDPDRAARQVMREAYLGDFPVGSYAEAFVVEADRWISGLGIQRGSEQEELDEIEAHEDEADQTSVEEPEPTRDSPRAEAVDAQAGARQSGVTTTVPADPGAGPAAGRGPAGGLASKLRKAGGPARGKLLLSGGLATLDGGSTATAAAAVVCAVAGAGRAWVLVLAALTVGWMCVVRPPWLQRSPTALLAGFAVQRTLLTLAIVDLLGRHGVSRAAAVILLVLLGSAPLVEMWVRTVLGIRRLRLVGLPTLDYEPTPAAAHPFVYLVGVVLLVAELVLATGGWSAVMLVLAAAYCGFLLVLLGLDLRLLLASQRAEARLGDALAAYRPQFAVYFASDVEAAYQLAMWMPYFERIGRRFIVITRTSATVPAIQELTSAPILLCPTLRSLDATVTPGLTTVFYVNNGLKNTHYIERRELEHIWLNHGDSEKPACFNPVHAIYDRIFTAGQAGIDRYARHGVSIAPEKFEIVGRPQVETIQVVVADHDAPSPVSPTVLYAPTWVGPFADSNVYSLPLGEQIVASLLTRGCTVIFRAHPLNYRYPAAVGYIRAVSDLLAADKKATGRQHVWGEDAEQTMSLEDCFNASDAMVADVSAVVSDYLYSEKPFSIVAMGGSSEQLVAEAPVAVAAYVVQADLANMAEVLEEMLGADLLRERRRQTKAYYLGDAGPATYADGFLGAARRHIDREGRAGAALVSQS
jgi:CDP-glycerol glycerophosphotransferase (TagB/SpsB family)